MLRWILLPFLLSLFASILVFGQRFEEGVHPLAEVANWKMAFRDASATEHGIAMFSGTDLVVVEPDGSAVPLPIPEDDMRSFQSLHQSGEKLVAVWNAKKGRKLGVLDFTKPLDGWTVRDLPQNSYSYVTCLGADTSGRTYASIYGAGVINFLPTPDAEQMDVVICPGVADGRMQALTSATSTSGAVWFVTQDSFQRDSFRPMGKAMQFKDGVMREIDIGEKPRTTDVVALANDRVFIAFSDRPGMVLDGSTGEPATAEGFDPAQLGNHAVFQAAQAPDGTLWMLSTPFRGSDDALTEREADRFHRLWRWDGSRLEVVHDGIDTVRENDLTYYGHIFPDIAAVSRDEVHVGTHGAGLFSWREEGGATWLDWRHGMPSLKITRVFTGGHFVLMSSKKGLYTVAGNWHELPATVNEEIVPFTTWSDMRADLLGRLHVLKGNKVIRLDRWEDGEWLEGPAFPLDLTNSGGFAFDSANRPWSYASSMTTTVFVAEDETSWTRYATPLEAFEAEVAAARPGYMPAYPSTPKYGMGLNRPLIVDQDEIWFVDRSHRLNILRDGTWTSLHYKNAGNRMTFTRAPYLNRRGRPRVIQGKDIMGFNEGRLVMVTQGGAAMVQASGNMQLQQRFQGGAFQMEQAQFGLGGNDLRFGRANVAANIAFFKDDERLKKYGKVKLVEADRFGNQWLTAGGHLLGVRGTNVVEVSLAGSPAAVEAITRLVPDGDGGLFLAYGSKKSSHRWVMVRPELKRYTFKVDTRTEANRIGISVGELDVPEESVRVRTRLDGGPWRNIVELYPVPEGKRIIQVQCHSRSDELAVSDIVTVTLDVDGDIEALIKTCVGNLGATDYASRRDARILLKEMGVHAREALLEAARSEDPEVRQVAIDLLREM